jgi:benzoate/toluate 1,2-dioxygenase beta subunit
MLDKPIVMAAPLDDLRTIEKFLIHEVQLLDERRFEEWRDLFAEDGIYWVPLEPDQTSGEGRASLFYDDKRIMDIRFERLHHPNIHAQSPPHRTCHVIGNITVESIDESLGECTVMSNMIMTDYRMGMQRLFSGRVQHRLRKDGETYKIMLKRVDLINCDDVFELIAVPF